VSNKKRNFTSEIPLFESILLYLISYRYSNVIIRFPDSSPPISQSDTFHILQCFWLRLMQRWWIWVICQIV